MIDSRSVPAASEAGFSLLEMLIVLAILGTMMALVLPRFSRPNTMSTRTIALRIVQEAGLARLAAVKSGSETRLQIDTDVRSIGASVGNETILIPPSISLEATVGKTSGTTVTRGDIRFLPDGSSSGGELRLSGQGERTIKVRINWLTGLATMVSQ